jgi:hypothetical protein
MTQYELWSVGLTIIGIFGGLITAFFAYQQLRRMAQAVESAVAANKLSTLANVLQLEDSIHQRRGTVIERSEHIKQLTLQKEINKDAVDSAKKMLDESIESYLNAVDRLCASLIRNLIPQDEYRKDYRPLIHEIMSSQNYKSFLGTGTPYRNIIKIHDEWAEQ